MVTEGAMERDETTGRRTGLKRRGILAAGAAVVAGIVAKKAAEENPVAADNGTWTLPYTGSTTVNGAAFSMNNSGTSAVSDAIDGFAGTGNGVYGSSSGNSGVHGRSSAAGYSGIFGEPVGNASNGVLGNGTGTGGVGVQGQNALYGVVGTVGNVDNTIGVFGYNTSGTGTNNVGVLGTSANGPGVRGTSSTQAGVYGSTTASSGGTGVYGNGGTGASNIGVRGDSPGFGVAGTTTTGTGVTGQATGGTGVFGLSSAAASAGLAGVVGQSNGAGVLGDGNGGSTGIGVQGQNGQYGVVGKVANVANSAAVYGNNTSTVAGGIGVYGISNTGYGVLGISNAGSPYSGLTGSVFTATGAAFAGGAQQASAYAAYFTGKVNIDGPFLVNGVQKFTLKHSDGTSRLVSGALSVEPVVEDFGTGQLTNGTATITLDAEFREVAETGDYTVFLTPGDGAGALRFARRTPTGFAVEEIGGTSSGAFAWRVVAKPKDGGGKVARLAKYEQPNIKIPGINDLPAEPPALAKVEKPAVSAPLVLPPPPEAKVVNGSSRPDSPPAPAPPARTTPPTAAPAAPASSSSSAPASAPAATTAAPPAPLPPSR